MPYGSVLSHLPWDRGWRRRSSFGLLRLALVQGLFAAIAAPLGGQSLAVVEPLQGLRFRSLAVGGERIRVTDSSHRAEWLVRGQGTVEVFAILPDALHNSSGPGQISLEFGYGDLAYILPGSSDVVLANPRHRLLLTLPESEMPVRILLGGRARSTGEEMAGDYGAPLSLVVSGAKGSQ